MFACLPRLGWVGVRVSNVALVTGQTGNDDAGHVTELFLNVYRCHFINHRGLLSGEARRSAGVGATTSGVAA